MRTAKQGTGLLCTGLAVTALWLSGCSDNTATKPPTTYKVRGKVVWANGQPLRGGRINFHPEAPSNCEAFAEIEKDGTFSLSTFGKDDGAMPGRYRVSLDPYSYKTGAAQQVAVVPTQYRDPRTSGLTAEVASGDTMLEPFRLQ